MELIPTVLSKILSIATGFIGPKPQKQLGVIPKRLLFRADVHHYAKAAAAEKEQAKVREAHAQKHAPGARAKRQPGYPDERDPTVVGINQIDEAQVRSYIPVVNDKM